MATKPVKHNVLLSATAATGVSPADYPLGSPQSRAAARTMLQEKTKTTDLTRDEFDCSLLYMGHSYFTPHMTPTREELKRTSAYRRGMELDSRDDSKRGFDGKSQEWIRFFMTYGREPRPGDVLRYSDLQAAKDLQLQFFIDAWRRQVPELVCPIEIREGKVFRRVKTSEYSNAAMDMGWRCSEMLPSYPTQNFAWLEDRRWKQSYPHEAIVYVGRNTWKPVTVQDTELADNGD